jgi:hypothetical protein
MMRRALRLEEGSQLAFLPGGTGRITRRKFVHDIGTTLSYAYVLRVPLLLGLTIGGLPLIALPRNAVAGSLLRGLFDVADPNPPGPWVPFVKFAVLTFTGLMAAATITIVARLILLDGCRRFEIDPLPPSPGIQLLVRLLPLSAAILLVGGVWVQSWGVLISPGNRWGAAAAALGTGVSIAGFIALMTTGHNRLWDAVFVRKGTFLTTNNVLVPVAEFMFAGFQRIVRLTPAGFVDEATGRILARHAFALLQFLMSALVYVGLFVLKTYWVSAGAPVIPTLCLILVLILLACWSLAGLTFLFDRYRVPLLTLLFAYGTVMSVFPWSDHFFQTVRHEATAVASPTASVLLSQRAGKPVVVVASAGGGIQAAAWTAHVIQGLQQDAIRCGDDFDGAITAMSAVSGGSVGAMYVVDAYRGGHLPAHLLEQAVKAAEASSLDQVAWGLTYPDLVWTLAPFLKPLHRPWLVKDRGSALEDAWKRTSSLGDATLDRWRRDLVATPQRERPAVLFNATVAETGQRMLLSTTTLETAQDDPGRREFALDFPDLDLPVTTAARLSATFPYVSPSSRVDRYAGFDDQYHYVDGGYYDNYGTATLVEWLDRGLRSLSEAARPSRVLVLEIRSFPNSTAAQPDGGRGLTTDALQPLVTLYAVRGAGQEANSNLNVQLLADDYNEASVFSATITFPEHLADDRDDQTPPLSWHLTPSDRGRLAAAWKDPEILKARQRVHNFMRLTDARIDTSCVAR